ncbi:MAG: Txe/YoeB family addiction module toxin [Mucilaginibacter sp.]|uniref:Txe/YoeB family addiction module toxin n=1 Tax=Mucilaginibacter sp. TaxID=1882438 RepID=UPI0034E48AF1
MGKYIIVVEKTAQKELQALKKSGDKASIKRVEIIFEELAEHPQTGTGKPEKLKFKLSGYWSRQINKKNRLIYRIDELVITVFVVSAIGHYGDK